MSWFEVDRDGLRQLLEGRDKSFVLRELVQNAWDESGVTRCDVTLTPIPGRPAARLVVDDDAPEGFYDLRHAYTLYARTRKRSSPEKRGRFNLGEKQVLALCRHARIVTTKGGVEFLEGGGRKSLRTKRDAGSVFEADLAMTRAEIDDALRAARTFLPPAGIATSLNGEPLPTREPLAVVEATLATEFEDEEGRYRSTRRKTEVRVHELFPGERAMVFELGLPIIETGDRWHYDIQQRVPMTADRDNVRPSFLQDVRAEVANALADRLTGDDVSEQWVRDASEDDRIEPETFKTICTKRWGPKRVVADPNDPKSRERAIAEGYTIVSPRALSKAEWQTARTSGAIPSSSALFPTSYADYEDTPEPDWTDEQRNVVALAKRVAVLALGFDVTVGLIRSKATTGADYAAGHMRFNVSRLGNGWFRPDNLPEQLRLIIHELGHQFGGHLDAAYYNGLARIGAALALAAPEAILKG